MEKAYEEILKNDFKLMRNMLMDIEKHLLTQEFDQAHHFYKHLQSFIYEATVDIYEHKRKIQDVGDALLDIEMSEDE
jgi:hypothetical protein